MNRKESIHPCAEDVIARYSDMVFRIALARTGNYSDAEDITQEVFLKYIQKNKSYTDWEHIKAWLIQVTSNLSKNLVTSAWNRRTAPLEEGVEAKVEMPDHSELLEAVEKLPEQYREIIRLHYLKGYPVQEISRKLEMKESTVKTRLSRGRKKLRDILGVVLLCAVTGLAGFALLRQTGESGQGGEEIPNMAGVVSGSSVWQAGRDDTQILAELEQDGVVVETSEYADFRESSCLKPRSGSCSSVSGKKWMQNTRQILVQSFIFTGYIAGQESAMYFLWRNSDRL